MKHRITSYLTLTFLLADLAVVYSQRTELLPGEVIAVTARPSRDSIILRWAPVRLHAWQLGNEKGYRIERYVLARNGRLLAAPEKQILHAALKPDDEHLWEDLVREEKYAAIAAQALFGSRFEVDLTNTDIFTIVNKAQENEQRFSFALFSADMSSKVARASGLMLTDRNVKPEEKYLYRIIINAGDTLRGSLFISGDEPYHTPAPRNLRGEFKDGYVRLRWDKNNLFRYTAYRLERSRDGNHFHPISDSPVITVSPSDQEDTQFHYAIDSLPNHTETFYYRVKGLTPFGEESRPSETISGTSGPTILQPPYISAVENHDNKSLLVHWDFPAESNDAINGFTLERRSNPKEPFIAIPLHMLPPVARTYADKGPGQVNYYRVIAHGRDGERYASPVFYGQLVDSIPPAPPTGLSARVHNNGSIDLSWAPAKEDDLFGYRVYKANYGTEELAQITTSPITHAFIRDTADLQTLNEHVYYSVMAVDKNQNHSNLSEVLKVALPDIIAPQPPVLLPVRSDGDGVALSWRPGPSEDVVGYAVYRKNVQGSNWNQVATLEHGRDSTYEYTDRSTPPGQLYFYSIVAIDDAGIESTPSPPVSGSKIDISLRPAVQWRKAIILREEDRVILRWTYDDNTAESFRIYKSANNQPLILHKTVPSEISELRDTLIPTENYTYRIMAVFRNGQKSALSAPLFVDY